LCNRRSPQKPGEPRKTSRQQQHCRSGQKGKQIPLGNRLFAAVDAAADYKEISKHNFPEGYGL